MSEVTVSYIIAVYNGERYLREAIDSVLKQTAPPLELIVVNDGSTDGTGDLIDSYGERVRHVRQDNAGQSAARNHGVRLARGGLVGFLDADDLIHPRKLEKQLAAFTAQPDLGLCDAWVRNFWSPEIPEDERRRDGIENLTHADEPWPEHISTWLVRRSLFQTLGGFEEGRMFGEDSEWHDRVKASAAAMHTLHAVLARRRLHHHNITRANYQHHLDGLAVLYRERINRQRSSS